MAKKKSLLIENKKDRTKTNFVKEDDGSLRIIIGYTDHQGYGDASSVVPMDTVDKLQEFRSEE